MGTSTFRVEMSAAAQDTCKEDGEDNDELVDGMSDDVFHHRPRDEWLGTSVRLSFQHLFGRQFSCQSQRRQRVHYQVHPQHLDRLQRRILPDHTRRRRLSYTTIPCQCSTYGGRAGGQDPFVCGSPPQILRIKGGLVWLFTYYLFIKI